MGHNTVIRYEERIAKLTEIWGAISYKKHDSET